MVYAIISPNTENSLDTVQGPIEPSAKLFGERPFGREMLCLFGCFRLQGNNLERLSTLRKRLISLHNKVKDRSWACRNVPFGACACREKSIKWHSNSRNRTEADSIYCLSTGESSSVSRTFNETHLVRNGLNRPFSSLFCRRFTKKSWPGDWNIISACGLQLLERKKLLKKGLRTGLILFCKRLLLESKILNVELLMKIHLKHKRTSYASSYTKR